ncbi:MAG: hypothetical protein IPG34_17900 [Rhodocyclaceae bacterium]|nr:hypothetical protein [Rhodocyclaceae bacterium]
MRRFQKLQVGWRATKLVAISIFLAFSSKAFSEYASIIISLIESKHVYDFLYYTGFAGAILIALDIYDVGRLRSFERKIYHTIADYYKGFIKALKVSILISNRSVLGVTVWYRASSLIVFIVYYLYVSDGNYIEDLAATKISPDTWQPFLLATITIQVACRLHDSSELFRQTGDIVGVIVLYKYSNEITTAIASHTGLAISHQGFIWFLLYQYFSYVLKSNIYAFSNHYSKMAIWALIVIGAAPYLTLKLASRVVPFLFFYPVYLITKLSLILKANSLLRHFGLALFIVAEIAKRVIEKS